jgi:hypothetical protein
MLHKKKKNSLTNSVEIKVFLGLNLFMGIKPLPAYTDYWSSSPDFRDAYISQFMSVNRFGWLLSHLHLNDNYVMPLPSRTQSLKAAIVFDRDVTVKASSKNALNLQNLIKTVKFLVSTLFFSRTMCLGFTITASWSKMPLIT